MNWMLNKLKNIWSTTEIRFMTPEEQKQIQIQIDYMKHKKNNFSYVDSEYAEILKKYGEEAAEQQLLIIKRLANYTNQKLELIYDNICIKTENFNNYIENDLHSDLIKLQDYLAPYVCDEQDIADLIEIWYLDQEDLWWELGPEGYEQYCIENFGKENEEDYFNDNEIVEEIEDVEELNEEEPYTIEGFIWDFFIFFTEIWIIIELYKVARPELKIVEEVIINIILNTFFNNGSSNNEIQNIHPDILPDLKNPKEPPTFEEISKQLNEIYPVSESSNINPNSDFAEWITSNINNNVIQQESQEALQNIQNSTTGETESW